MWWLLLSCADDPADERQQSGPPCLVTEAIVDLGEISPGSTSSAGVGLQNGCEGTLTLESIVLDDPTGPFSFRVTPALQLDAGEQTAIVVDFYPVAAGDHQTTMRVVTNDPARPEAEIVLQGIGLAPEIAVAGSLDFADTWVGCGRSEVLTLGNTGTTVLDVVSARWEGDPAFALEGALPLRLFAGESVDLAVMFSPAEVGEAHGALVLETSDPGRPEVTIPVAGFGSVYGSAEEEFVKNWPSTVGMVMVVDDSLGSAAWHERLVAAVPELVSELERSTGWNLGVLPASALDFTTATLLRPGSSFYESAVLEVLPEPLSEDSPDGLQHAYEAAVFREDIGQLTDGPDDSLAIWFVSMQDDHGAVAVEDAIARWESVVDDPIRNLRVHALVSDGSCGEEGARYAQAAAATRGVVRSACEADWGPILAELARRSLPDGRTFPLAADPVVDRTVVTVDFLPVGWAWDAEISAIVLDEVLPDDAILTVTYDLPPICE